MKKRNIWMLALVCSAATLAISTVNAGNAPRWRMYAGMPGLYIAMIAGWLGLAHNMTSIYIGVFLINGLVYYAPIRLIFALANVRSQ